MGRFSRALARLVPGTGANPSSGRANPAHAGPDLTTVDYRRLVETLPDGLYQTTPDGRFLACNPALIELLGYESEWELRDLDIARDLYLDPRQRDEWARQLERQGQLRNVETVLRRKDGRRIVVLESSAVVRDDRGDVLYYEGTLTDISGRKQAEEVQSVLLRIFEAASTAKSLRQLLESIHRQLGRLIDTCNFYVALYNEQTGLYSFPYLIDKYEPEDPPPQKLDRSLTDYVRRTGSGLLVDEKLHEQLMRQGEVELIGVASPIWMGVPLKTGERVVGVVAVQSYEQGWLYTEEDLQLLSFVAENIALAIDRKRAEEELQTSERRFRDLFEASPDAMFVEDHEGNVLDVNPAACRLQRMSREELIGRNVSELVSPESVEEALHNHRRLATGEVERVEGVTWTADGHAVPVEVRVGSLEYAGRAALLVQVRDITERKQYEAQLEFLARFDALTELPNRYLFEDRLDQAIAGATRSAERVALLYLDLDEFKTINDTQGHLVGDQLLKEAGKRLRELVRDSDSVARLGGDEFAIIQPGVKSATEASALAMRVLEAMSLPFRVAGHEIHTSTSIGISLSSPGADRQDLMLEADRALYKAKEKGRRGFHFHNEELAEEVQSYVTLRHDLHQAIERGELFLEYQPQVDLKRGTIVGSEALVRWRHPQRGLLGPGSFIPVSERTGLVVPVGAWILEEACRQRRAWSDMSLPPVPVAVNLSPVQFRDPNFADSLLRVVRRAGIDPSLLELELTESILMEASAEVHEVLARSNRHGIKMSIDDFGTGYSSLRYLRQFPVHKLKIAMEFVQGVTDDPNDASIVDAVITLGHKLGLTVIAEGVETDEQVDFLRRHDCDEAQGYFFGRPAPPEGFAEQLVRGA